MKKSTIIILVVVAVIALVAIWAISTNNSLVKLEVSIEQKQAEIDNQLSESLKTIMAVAENYPDLKANQNFSELQEELRNTENKISFARQFYNDTVTMYNEKLQMFPSNIIANMFHFNERDLFEAESDEARKNVKVDFGTKA